MIIRIGDILKKIRAIGLSFCICLLFTFMLLIFGPSEIFFANNDQFQFVFGDFALRLILISVIFSVIYGIIAGILPAPINRIMNGIILGISIAGYIQVMFLNKGLDLMGLNADGYNTTTAKLATNIAIWIVIIALSVFASIKATKQAYIAFATFALGVVQLTALISLVVTAKEECFSYPKMQYHLSGDEQYCLSNNENTVVFILDCFSNLELDNALIADPDCLAPFNDFTRYDNGDCVYFGTFPSVTHMFTHDLVNFDLTVNEWLTEAWGSEPCTYFYDEIHKKDYRVNFYTNELTVLTGGNKPEDLIAGKIDNFNEAPLERIVDRPALTKGMVKMSAYRLFPDILKNHFYAQASDYQDVVKVIDDPINHQNYDFISGLREHGLSTIDCPGMLTVQHLMGTHVFQNDVYGERKDDASAEETAIGCLYIVSEYLEEMKRLGLYDSSTIIVTADHGSAYGQVPIFLLKRAGETSDSLSTNIAPISHMDFLATLADFSGIDPTPIGPTIDSFNPGDERERKFYLRDNMDDYPRVPCYTGDKEGGSNVYLEYTYTGLEDDLLDLLFDYYSDVIPMIDCYY